MKKALLFIISLIIFTKVYAFENDYFQIKIDESFKEQTINNTHYLFTKDNEYYSITIDENINDYDISKFTEEDILKQKKYLENKYSNSFSKYSDNVSITNIELKSNKTIYYLEYDIYFNTKEKIGYNIYQKCRMFTSNNYVYSILYNSPKEITDNKVLDSFIIKDSYLKKVNPKVYTILLVVMLIMVLLFDFLLHKKRR